MRPIVGDRTAWSKVAAVLAVIAPIITFALGYWLQLKGSDIASSQLDLQKIQAALEIRKQMNATLEEIEKLPADSPQRAGKSDYFNELEKSLARIEGRRPVIYKWPSAPRDLRIE